MGKVFPVFGTRKLPGPISFERTHFLPLAIALFFCGVSLGTAGIDFVDRDALEEAVSDNGAVTLSWRTGEDGEIVLEQSTSEEFPDPVVRYRGTDSGSVLTALPEGVHFFRVGVDGSGDWSSPLRIEVEFFDRSALFLLFGIGGAVVVSTVGAIVAGHLRTRNQEDADP